MLSRFSSRFSLPALLSCGAVLAAPPAEAWGPYGHAIVAEIAQDRLSPQAAKAVKELLALENHHTLDEVASWPDTIGHVPKNKGGAPETLLWHYVDIDVNNRDYDRTRDCPADACVVEKLPALEKTLADRNAPAAERLVALKWVVHLVGDIHQPLHAAQRDDDKGGNTVRLTYEGDNANGHMNLHALWDGGIIDHQAHLTVGPYYSIDPAAARAVATRLGATITPDEATYWAADVQPGHMRDATIDWTDESHALARTVAYGALTQNRDAALGDSYTAIAWPIIQLRLKQAGVRLAAVLNEALATP
ncbi:S1/P1 nuclease [Brytella acorum]|uniref:S1/P1 nuclease n=1 Tax=Brytella acorum TaxID=2959299 RepID=A0AA35UUZ6_9PROT|nr:S1/P1 nuclease [Brytella acorum]MDF3624860.1 S1/P1 nuclease [Brytella acorum]CAI9120163.1 S1/P1 nuclease [Brytella acorum]